MPCVYGSGLTKDMRGTPTPEGLCPDTCGECVVIGGTCLLGSLMPCMTGIYIRSVSGDEHCATAVLAECCPMCSCAPCQMNQYRDLGTPVQQVLGARL
jgi:hypothetical protein